MTAIQPPLRALCCGSQAASRAVVESLLPAGRCLAAVAPRGQRLSRAALIVAWALAAGWGPLASLPAGCAAESGDAAAELLDWSELPPLPDELGVAGPFAGVHNDVLIVAGGANFPRPVWESDKVWHDRIYVLTLDDDQPRWRDGGRLPRPTAYGAAVSTQHGVLCIGGNDATQVFDDVYLLAWDEHRQEIVRTDLPPLPQPCAFSAATIIETTVYVAGGQSGLSLDSAMNQLWSLSLETPDGDHPFEDASSRKNAAAADLAWRSLPPCPGPSRALNLTVSQHNGYLPCVYVASGRRQEGDDVQFLRDVWEYNPESAAWRRRADAPRCVMAGAAASFSQSHILVLSGDPGELFFQADTLKDDHPGFPRRALAYHTITDTWTEAGATPANQVTTIAVPFGEEIIVASGEVRPRVRSPQVYRILAKRPYRDFGALNYVVLFGYLLSMVGVGAYFARSNKTTDDFFRGGMRMPWWAAGCSIFATMLSSLTFTGIPSKAYAQDWVYCVGNFMIPVVAFIAVYVALPFYRRIDATSAYEYLEKRFSRPVRLFGSASFTLFHIFRMAVVMSLTGLALAVATPLTPMQSVALMGALSILYCTMGGIEAVIWTDTIQTVVLLGGALIAGGLMLAGTDGGWSGFVESASQSGKFRMANLHADPTSAQIALWVIVIGAIGQNISSYTADQAVVQRYMTTPDQRLAARSIWTNAALSVPASLIFFGIGSALFAFYRSHPEKLDPTISTDQIFPLFIAEEMPAGLAGLIVAGIFAAAQSTVSTSMNSTATALVTDFLRPAGACRTERSYLRAARWLTVLTGVIGTALGLVFVNPDIKSLFDTFLIVIGLFMGVLGGLFVLGAVTRRANAAGALTGAVVGAAVMFSLWRFTPLNGYLYTACGITTCVVVGMLASLAAGPPPQHLEGLTLYTLTDREPPS